MQLKNVHIKGSAGLQQITIDKEIITSVEKSDTTAVPQIIFFDDAITFPGLINSHDHLDFNLFPQLNNRTYNNYTEWANDIHATKNKTIKSIQNIPKELRIKWGIYKNLINGVTTVVDHGDKIEIDTDLITVFQNCYSLHSLSFERNWKWKLNDPFTKYKTIVIHIGEGTDEFTKKEIDTFNRYNFLKRKVVAVHGVAMDKKQAGGFEALIWCPDTNYNLLGKTAAVDQLKNKTTILFGTDSTLTAHWNIWQQLRIAHDPKLASSDEIFDMLTKNAARVWGLNTGSLAPQMRADIVIAKLKADFFDLNPEDILMVIRHGEIKLFDETMTKQVSEAGIDVNGFSKIFLNGTCKYIKGNLPTLIKEIKSHYPSATFPIQLHK